MEQADLEYVEELLRIPYGFVQQEMAMLPDRLRVHFGKLQILEQLAGLLDRDALRDEIRGTLASLFPRETPVKVTDGAYIGFNGEVVGDIASNGRVKVRLDIYGKPFDMDVDIESLEVRAS